MSVPLRVLIVEDGWSSTNGSQSPLGAVVIKITSFVLAMPENTYFAASPFAPEQSP
jgi:hypothetical protein